MHSPDYHSGWAGYHANICWKANTAEAEVNIICLSEIWIYTVTKTYVNLYIVIHGELCICLTFLDSFVIIKILILELKPKTMNYCDLWPQILITSPLSLNEWMVCQIQRNSIKALWSYCWDRRDVTVTSTFDHKKSSKSLFNSKEYLWNSFMKLIIVILLVCLIITLHLLNFHSVSAGKWSGFIPYYSVIGKIKYGLFIFL